MKKLVCAVSLSLIFSTAAHAVSKPEACALIKQIKKEMDVVSTEIENSNRAQTQKGEVAPNRKNKTKEQEAKIDHLMRDYDESAKTCFK